jgi:hypothetical protein
MPLPWSRAQGWGCDINIIDNKNDMGIARTWGYLHFNFVINAPSQHEGITKTWSIVIQVSSHHDWSNVCNTFSHNFAIVMTNI